MYTEKFKIIFYKNLKNLLKIHKKIVTVLDVSGNKICSGKAFWSVKLKKLIIVKSVNNEQIAQSINYKKIISANYNDQYLLVMDL